MDFQEKAKLLVAQHENKRNDQSTAELKSEDVFIVWFAKTLQNWKCVLATTRSDGMLYEVTYNGDKKETYVDSYKKWENSAYPDGEE